MADFPLNHHTRFCDAWWNEQRKRDFFVDDDGCVKLRPDSATAKQVEAALWAQYRAMSGATVH